MIHLRLIVPSELAHAVVGHLAGEPGVAHLVRLPGAAVVPPGELVLCDVAREAANEVVEWLQQQDVHHHGSITIETSDAVVSDAAARADRGAPGEGGDALIWEQLEARARDESQPTTSFLVLMSVAAVIAAVGILLDSTVLLVGAMVVGPEYGPIAAACVGLSRRRFASIRRPAGALAVGFLTAATAALVATLAFRATGLAADDYTLTARELTSFVAHPDALAAVVAVLAGIAGMLALTESRSGALVGVLVSVTTVPAIANVGVAAAYLQWHELGAAAAQLGLNVAGLLLAGVATLAVQHRLTARR